MSEALAELLRTAVPFNAHLGLEVLEVAPGRGVVRLPVDPRLQNHIATQHAGALFTAAEAASGAAILGCIAEHLATITPLARTAQVRYRRPSAEAVTATATLAADPAELVARTLEQGKAEATVHVALVDAGGTEVATVEVAWYLRRNPG